MRILRFYESHGLVCSEELVALSIDGLPSVVTEVGAHIIEGIPFGPYTLFYYATAYRHTSGETRIVLQGVDV